MQNVTTSWILHWQAPQGNCQQEFFRIETVQQFIEENDFAYRRLERREVRRVDYEASLKAMLEIKNAKLGHLKP